jgi:exosortase/archaeosortase family protein
LAQKTKKKKNRESATAEKSASAANTRKNNRLILRFLLCYVGLMGIFLLLIGLKPVQEVLDLNGLYTRMIIYLSEILFKPFGIVQGSSGSVIFLPGLSLDVKFGCNGLEAFLIYTVGILAFPSKVMTKIWGILGGFLLLQFLNVLRIVGLGLIGIYFKNFFDTFHIYVAQGIMIAISVVLFLIWLHYVNQE